MLFLLSLTQSLFFNLYSILEVSYLYYGDLKNLALTHFYDKIIEEPEQMLLWIIDSSLSTE
jgi:hypothetical protein